MKVYRISNTPELGYMPKLSATTSIYSALIWAAWLQYGNAMRKEDNLNYTQEWEFEDSCFIHVFEVPDSDVADYCDNAQFGFHGEETMIQNVLPSRFTEVRLDGFYEYTDVIDVTQYISKIRKQEFHCSEDHGYAIEVAKRLQCS
jgi:hypothetical protein